MDANEKLRAMEKEFERRVRRLADRRYILPKGEVVKDEAIIAELAAAIQRLRGGPA